MSAGGIPRDGKGVEGGRTNLGADTVLAAADYCQLAALIVRATNSPAICRIPSSCWKQSGLGIV